MTEPDLSAAYPPHVLREYALLADGERGALVGPRGDVAWMCAPRWDSPAVFSSLIGGRGVFAVTPVGRFVWGGYYEDAGLIWRSRWITESGVVECREALAFPGDPHRAVLLRRILPPEGPVEVDLLLDLATDFGRAPLKDLERDGPCWRGRSGRLHVRTSGWVDATPRGGSRLQTQLRLPPGAWHDVVLEIADGPLDDAAPDPALLWEATETAWREASPPLGNTLAPRDARHSYAILRGLTSSGGGMVASATMSLPERADQGRNYDYRYVWIRDQSYAGQAVAADGPHPLLDDAVSFVAARLLDHGAHLAPAYTVAGERIPDERTLDLPGYPGGTDVVGNQVNAQFQLDAFGEALLLFAAAARHDHLDVEHIKAASAAVEAIRARGQEPDAGVWELDARRWAHSRLICAAGLRAIAAHLPSNDAGHAAALADAVVADTAADCLHSDGRWQRAPGDPRVDAALLLPALRGALSPSDPRSVATLTAVGRELGTDGYLYRFRHDARPLGRAEGAFLLCGFWMAMATRQQGAVAASARWFERNRAACGPPGLFAEECDVTERQLRGNLPQAFVHAAMLEAAVRLAGPDTEWMPEETPEHPFSA